MSPSGTASEDAMVALALLEHHNQPSPAPALPENAEEQRQKERPVKKSTTAEPVEAMAEAENKLDDKQDDTKDDTTAAEEDDGVQGCPIRAENKKPQVDQDMAAVQAEAREGTVKGKGKEPCHEIEGDQNMARAATEGPAMAARRRKIQIRRIECRSTRQVTFCKRRNGLLKKAHELSVLCDADILLLIFSGTGKLFEFASSSARKILDRYRKYIAFGRNGAQQAHALEFWRQEAFRLKGIATLMDLRNRNMLGEDLGCMQIKDLERLEGELESSLGQIKSRKTQMLVEDIHGLYERDCVLSQENDLLRFKLAKLSMQSPIGLELSSLDMQDSSSPNKITSRQSFAGLGQKKPSTTIVETALHLGHFKIV